MAVRAGKEGDAMQEKTRDSWKSGRENILTEEKDLWCWLVWLWC